MMRIVPFDYRSLSEPQLPPEAPLESSAPEATASEEPLEPAPPPVLTFSAQDVDTAEKIGFEKGMKAGFDEGFRQAKEQFLAEDAALRESVSGLIEVAVKMRKEHDQWMQDQQEALLSLSLAVAKKITGLMMADEAETVVRELIVKALAEIGGDPAVIIEVHPKLVDVFSKRLKELKQEADFQGELEVAANPALGESDTALLWKGGKMERKSSDIWQELQEQFLAIHDHQQRSRSNA